MSIGSKTARLGVHVNSVNLLKSNSLQSFSFPKTINLVAFGRIFDFPLFGIIGISSKSETLNNHNILHICEIYFLPLRYKIKIRNNERGRTITFRPD